MSIPNNENEIVLLLYNFEDLAKMGQIVKIMYDFGVRDVRIISDEVLDDEEILLIKKNARDSAEKLDIDFTQHFIGELAAEFREEGFKIVGFSNTKPNQSCFDIHISGKICLVVGANEQTCYLYEYLDKELDYKLFFPKEISENPDEISRAMALLNCTMICED